MKNGVSLSEKHHFFMRYPMSESASADYPSNPPEKLLDSPVKWIDPIFSLNNGLSQRVIS